MDEADLKVIVRKCGLNADDCQNKLPIINKLMDSNFNNIFEIRNLSY